MNRLGTICIFLTALFLQACTSFDVVSSLRFDDKPSFDEPGDDWFKDGQRVLAIRKGVEPANKKAKNVILFVGDGMGVSTVTASRIYEGQSLGKTGEEGALSFEAFPHVALVKTYNTNQQVPDSAGTATAMHTGVKTRAGMLGVRADAQRGSCREARNLTIATIGEYAERLGMATGVVTTTRITHATPASMYAHTPERDWEHDGEMPDEAIRDGCIDIARQLIEFSEGDGIDVALGGGRSVFLGADRGGKRKSPEADLVTEWRDANPERRKYIESADELAELNNTGGQQVLGLFHDSHLSYMVERAPNNEEPTLSQMTAKAVELLSTNENGYYLLVEGGRIDHGHHAGTAERALAETQEFSKAVQVALSLVDLDETLVLVTADHSHVFTMAGYPTRGNPILGVVVGNDAAGNPESEPKLALDGQPYTTLGYWNGPGAASGNRDHPTEPQHGQPFLVQQAVIPTGYHSGSKRLLSETHGGEDVALYANGARSHLVGGVLEQNVIFHIIAHAFGWEFKE